MIIKRDMVMHKLYFSEKSINKKVTMKKYSNEPEN